MDRRPLGFAAAGALVIAFSAILVRLAEVSPSTAAVFRCAYALPLLGYLAHRERRLYGPRVPRERNIALLAGIFFAAGSACFSSSFPCGKSKSLMTSIRSSAVSHRSTAPLLPRSVSIRSCE